MVTIFVGVPKKLTELTIQQLQIKLFDFSADGLGKNSNINSSESSVCRVPFKGSIRVCSFGGLGSGKTLVGVRRAEQYHYDFPDRPIYSNIHLCRVPYKKIDSIQALFDIIDIDEPCFVFLDEFWTTNDSSDKTIIQQILSVVMAMSRKLGWEVYMSEQWFTQLQLRTRFITDIWAEPVYDEETQIIMVPFRTKYGEDLGGYMFNAKEFFEGYHSFEPPFTVNVEELKEKYLEFAKKHRIN